MVVPANDARGVNLEVLTVDVQLSESWIEGSFAIRAETRVWLRLGNPTTRTLSLPIALIPLSAEGALGVQSVEASLNEKPLALAAEAAVAAKGTGAEEAPVSIQIPGSGRVTIRLTCVEEMGQEGILLEYRFPLSGSTRWAGTPESLRVTIDHTDPPSMERFIDVSPPPVGTVAWPLEWQWTAERAGGDVALQMLDAEWWDQNATARQVALSPTATSGDHLRYAGFLEQIDQMHAQRGAPESGAALRQSALLAQYLAATTAPGSADDRAVGQRALVRLYMERAAESDSQASDLQAALNGLRAARELGSSTLEDDALEQELVTRLRSQAQLAGEVEVAARYTEQAASRGTAIGQDAASSLLSRAMAAVEGGDLAEARALIVEAFGAGIDQLPDASAAALRLSEVTVRQYPQMRETMFVLQGPGAGALRTEVTAILAETPGLSVEQVGEGVTFRMSFASRDDLVAAMAKVAALIPDRPELELLRATLTPSFLRWEGLRSLLQPGEQYLELVDLATVATKWRHLADRFQNASGWTPAGFSLGEDAAGVLRRVQKAIWLEDAASWRELSRASSATFLLSPSGGEEANAKRMEVGESRLMVVQEERLAIERVQALGVLLVPLLLLLVALAVRGG